MEPNCHNLNVTVVPTIYIKNKINPAYTQSGFTLMELMIALTLGLLIVAAGLALFLNSHRSLNFQSGMDEVQQNANFGFSAVTYDLRHTNLNTVSSQRVNSYTLGSGIVFKKENLPVALRDLTNLETGLVSLHDKDTANTGTAVNKKSDRITIQYVPQANTVVNCEGVNVTNASSKVIVQRYYVAASPQQITGEPTAYSLYCDAGSYAINTPVTPAVTDPNTIGLGTGAQQIMQRVDAFKVRLGVKNPAGQLRYMTIKQYTDAMDILLTASACAVKTATSCTSTFLQVVSIEVGILVRSTGTIGADAEQNTRTTFNLAGTDVTLSGDANVNKRYLRQAVNQVVAIRNTLGAS
ncbi:prepilin-type N-terminal cleavage/methylation domain-containing protein [Acinetobacter beijerinckii]|uniref:PilW family protein n=1 Tax=Acinetobacter beijerinckii TaxID=262668 RepID=UPI003B8A725C|nr:prepilin-type N-terminal cleavage/methylation domain-containing protein [Acinetobacter beijerinckii]